MQRTIGFGCGVASILLAAGLCHAAPQLTLTPLEPLETDSRPTEAVQKAAAFGGGRWLVVYTSTTNQISGVWLRSDGKLLSKSFPLLGGNSVRNPRLAFDGESFVLSWIGGEPAGVKVARIRVDADDTAPEIAGPWLGDDGFQATTVDAASVVHVAACANTSANGPADCTLSKLTASALVAEATFTLPSPVRGLKLEAAPDGALLFVEGAPGVSVVHVNHAGSAEAPVVLSATGASMNAARREGSYVVAWTDASKASTLRAALLDATGQVVSTQGLDWDIDVAIAPQLVGTTDGFALAAQGGECEECDHNLLMQTFSESFQPLSLDPHPIVANARGPLLLATDGERLLAGWNVVELYSLHAAVLDPARLGRETPQAATLSFEVVPHGMLRAAPIPEGWLAVWTANRASGDEVSGQRLDPRGVAHGERFVVAQPAFPPTLLDASGGPSGALLTWEANGVMSATFVPPDGPAAAPHVLGAVTESKVVASPGGGWVLARVAGDKLLADRFAADGSVVSTNRVIASAELLDLTPTDHHVGINSFSIAPTEDGFVLVWSCYVERFSVPNEFHFSHVDAGVFSRQLDADGQPLAAEPRAEQRSSSDGRGVALLTRLSVAASGESSWLAWRDSSYAFFFLLPLPETLENAQSLERGDYSDFLELRAVHRDVVATWNDYAASYIALAEPGQQLTQRRFVGSTVTALSAARLTAGHGALLLSSSVSDRLYGGGPGRERFILADVGEPDPVAVGGGGGGGEASAAGAPNEIGSGGGGRDPTGGNASFVGGANDDSAAGAGNAGETDAPRSPDHDASCDCGLAAGTSTHQLLTYLTVAALLLTVRTRGEGRRRESAR